MPLKLTFGEEVANAITHGVASLLVLFSFPVATIVAYEKGSTADVVGVTVFCISIFMMFLMSTIYHVMEPETKHKSTMRILDHIFIYVAIAGTYTPIAISVIGGWQAVVLPAVQ
jgi:hemolysin III